MSDTYNRKQEAPLTLFNWYYEQSDEVWVQTTWHDLHDCFDKGEITADTMVTWEGLGTPGFPFQYINAEFFYVVGTIIQHAYSEAELHAAAQEGKINPSTTIWGRVLPAKGIPYSSFRFLNVTFDPDIKQFINERRQHPTTVLSGPNDSGKTLILKLLRRELGPAANFVACNRFYHIDHLDPATEQSGQYERRYESFVAQLYQQRLNTENNDFPLPQVVSQMKDAQRNTLFSLCSEMLGERYYLDQVDHENKISQYYIAVEGQNLAISSTGTRLLMMIVAACLDERYSILLLDEPEMGLSPSLQTALARYLLGTKRQEYFPHLKQLFIATHSHLLLDRADPLNNFVVTRENTEITIRKIESISGFHNLQFNMLGNTLEALFLPAAIVIVEGPTDEEYINRIFQMLLPDKRVSVVRSNGEGDTKNKLHVINSSLGNLQMSPYRQRIFILLDSTHTVQIGDFTQKGIPPDNVVILEKNGIEYYYPKQILADMFACNEHEVHSLLEIGDNSVRIRDVEMSKKQLCRGVLDRLTSRTEIPMELITKLLEPIKLII